MGSKNYTQVVFSATSDENNGILIALLNEAGYSGFEEEPYGLKAFIASEAFNAGELDQIAAKAGVIYEHSDIAEQNWNALWESSFEPIRVNDFAVIRAAFHAPVTDVLHEIVITPKMSFGTGHHATTYLMIEQMSAMDFKDKSVLDFGTGTGILAILAEKMGARQVTAIDNDDWSIENAQENKLANGCSRINIYNADAIPANEQYDIILANINLNVIQASLPAIINASGTDTEIYLSGFLRDDELVLFRALAGNGFACVAISQKGEWICLHIKKMQ